MKRRSLNHTRKRNLIKLKMRRMEVWTKSQNRIKRIQKQIRNRLRNQTMSGNNQLRKLLILKNRTLIMLIRKQINHHTLNLVRLLKRKIPKKISKMIKLPILRIKMQNLKTQQKLMSNQMKTKRVKMSNKNKPKSLKMKAKQKRLNNQVRKQRKKLTISIRLLLASYWQS